MAAKTENSELDRNTSGALAYVLGPITGAIFLIIEKDKFVRFHAVQSIVSSGVFVVLLWILKIIGIGALTKFWIVLGFIFYLLLVYKTWQGEEWEVPILGKYARDFMKKI